MTVVVPCSSAPAALWLLASAVCVSAQDLFLPSRSVNAAGNDTFWESAPGRKLQGGQRFGDGFVGEIRWAGGQDLCLDVAGGYGGNGNKLQVWRCIGNANQQFVYDPTEEMPQIKWAKDPSKCIDVASGNPSNFADVVMWDCHPLSHSHRKNQAFFGFGFFQPDYGWFNLQWYPYRHKCIDLKDGLVGSWKEEKSKVHLYECHELGHRDWDHQQWVANANDVPSTCSTRMSEEKCLWNRNCGWCGGEPAFCYNKNSHPRACEL
eukprot:TRINITY_DN126083_c0_g1_i1.p1 TRINITY_DN126083_c0_g1~~TRINITY_DN126083_c0_g1_i1.p1  ORF type:complete len:263 (+),score=38.43 TRINITY_DN126083_c0_g1_i1:56-844(+)